MTRITFLLGALILLSLPIAAQIDFTGPSKTIHPQLLEMDSLISSGKYEEITSVLVIKDAELLFEKYYQENDSTSLHNTRSATKSLATILTGIAIDQGYIESEKDKIFDYLGENLPVQNPDPRKLEITIEDLLTMSSVLECNDWNEHSRGHEMKMYYIEDWTQFLVDLPVRSYPFNGPPESRPYGRAFAYASAKSAAVGDIVQRAVGQQLDSFAIEHLFTPLDIKNYKLDYSPMGVLNTAGGSEYRSRDLAKMIQLFLNQGTWDNQQIMSAAWVEKAITPHVHAYDKFDYSYLLWLASFGSENQYPAYYMSGNGGNKVMAIPALDACVVITTTNYNNRNAQSYTTELVNKYIIPSLTTAE